MAIISVEYSIQIYLSCSSVFLSWNEWHKSRNENRLRFWMRWKKRENNITSILVGCSRVETGSCYKWIWQHGIWHYIRNRYTKPCAFRQIYVYCIIIFVWEARGFFYRLNKIVVVVLTNYFTSLAHRYCMWCWIWNSQYTRYNYVYDNIIIIGRPHDICVRSWKNAS